MLSFLQFIRRLRDELKFRQLAQLARELKLPHIEAFLTVEVLDGAGEVIYHHRQRSRSWVRNAYNLLFSELAAVNANDSTYGAGLLSVKDTGGTVRYGATALALIYTQSMLGAGFGYTCAAGSNVTGIQAGNSDQVESFEDNALIGLIANGTGGGQLSYIFSEPYTYAYVAGTKTLTATLIRFMNNNSGGDVLIKEVGLVASMYAGGSSRNIMTSRDKLGVTVTIPNTGQFKATYTLALVYPA